MPFLQLTLEIGKSDPTPLEETLLAAGALSITLEDGADDPVLEPGPGMTPLWPNVRVKALFVGDAIQNEIINAVSARHESLPHPHFAIIEDRIWEREWLKDFKPMRFGKRLWVCPGGMLPPQEFLPLEGSQSPVVLIQLDPGLAFGTGTHPTTSLCLEWLDGADLSNRTIIDYGCGSGVLAIAALKLGAQSAIGIDIDPQALLATRDNAERNAVSERIQLQDSSEQQAPADILMANILAGPLNELAPGLAKLVKPGGHIVLSGILKEQFPDLAQLYGSWFDMGEPEFRDDWVRLAGIRKTDR